MRVLERRRAIVAVEQIERAILFLRAQKVMLDFDLALLYGVTTKALNQAVRRNLDRFPADFMFELTKEEAQASRSQSVTLKQGRGEHRKYRSHAFTEQGLAMLSSVLRSSRAISVNVEIMRAFVRIRRMIESNSELARRPDALEAKYDGQFSVVFKPIRALMIAPERPRRRIGFDVSARERPRGRHGA